MTQDDTLSGVGRREFLVGGVGIAALAGGGWWVTRSDTSEPVQVVESYLEAHESVDAAAMEPLVHEDGPEWGVVENYRENDELDSVSVSLSIDTIEEIGRVSDQEEIDGLLDAEPAVSELAYVGAQFEIEWEDTTSDETGGQESVVIFTVVLDEGWKLWETEEQATISEESQSGSEEPVPQISFHYDFERVDGIVEASITIEVEAGDVDSEDVYLRGSAVPDGYSWAEFDAEIAAGERVTLREGEHLVSDPVGESIDIVYEKPTISETLDWIDIPQV